MRNLRWKNGKVVSLALRDNLHTLAQMARSPFMQFFDILRTTDDWTGVDLRKTDKLFQVPIGCVVTQNLVSRVIGDNEIRHGPVAIELRWIKPLINYDGFVFRCGDLIEFSDTTLGNTVRAPKIRQDLTVEADRLIIEKTEMTNMWGDLDLGDRLRRYFDTGIDRDDLKFEVFPGLWDDREALAPLTRRLPVPLRGGPKSECRGGARY